ncbi:MAG TPA: aminotransferase class V-fold PLP-dependent enzyme [Gemmataceae bacterium]|nr:aminotransferase class V-fold PLP-dependent enzyme [Gemmataceae bacterium]
MKPSSPALVGGSAIRPQGPPEWPAPDDTIRDSLLAAYADGSWGKYHGPHVEALHCQLAAYHGVEFALSCGSGTFAVELALRALQVGPGDEVILAAYDFPGNFLTIHAIGAMPVLVDVAPHHWNLTAEAVAQAVSGVTKAVIVSHLHGGLVDMPALMELARTKGFAVVEDACQCPGATVAGRKAGTWGDVGVLSFGGSKLLTAGRGGAIITRRADVHQRAKTYQMRGNLVCPMSELQAAVLPPQLARLDERNAERQRRVSQLFEALSGVPGLRPLVNLGDGHTPGYYKLGFQFDADAFGLERAAFIQAMRAEGIAFDDGFRAAHVGRSPKRFRQVGPLSEASRADQGMVILHHPVLLAGEQAIAEVAEAIHKTHQGAAVIREHLQRTIQ